jgi:hypothetical protein
LSDFLWCFFAFFSDLVLSELSLPIPVLVEAPPPLGTALDEAGFEVSSGGFGVFASVSLAGAELAAGLLLGREVLLEEVLDELPGRALLFWFAGSVAVPLSSVVGLFGVEVVLVSLFCARAANADRAIASAAIPMIFIEPPWL